MRCAVKYVSIKKLNELSRYTEDAIRTKFRDGKWLEGKVWVKVLDGRILINIEGYEEWVEMGAVYSKHQTRVMKSPLPIVENAARSASKSSPAQLIANV